tara:strand:+ start:1851 stop:2411 length:561 start_codon:yes stop_codon:yes gene_type:complete
MHSIITFLKFFIVFFSLYVAPDENKDDSSESTIILVENLPCVLEEEKLLDKEVVQTVKTEKDFSKKLLESQSICKPNQPSSNTAAISAASNDIESYLSSSGSEQSNENSPDDENNIDANEKSIDLSSKDPKVRSCIQNLNLKSEVEENIIDEIGKTDDENIKKILIKELSNISSQSVEVLENQCFN